MTRLKQIKLDAIQSENQHSNISAFSSKELDKYEYLTDKLIGYKPEVLEKAKFEYSLLGEDLYNKTKSKADNIDKIDK